MAEPASIIETLKRNQWIVQAQTDGLSHADSLLQLPFRGNCLNWVLGHLAVHRDEMLENLGGTAVVSADDGAPYGRKSQPLLSDERALTLENLLGALAEQVEQLSACLEQSSPEALAKIINEERGYTLGEHIEFYLWHDTYHVGQLEYLRQLAGKDDSIIS